MALPAKAQNRIREALKKLQPVVQSQKSKDINESDTVTLVTDILEQVFGYDRYNEITSEYAIRGSYCDLAVKVEGHIVFLIEVKMIGADLKEQHVKQAVNYAAHEGKEWVILTNGNKWVIYKIYFEKPVNYEIVDEFEILSLSSKSQKDIDLLGLIAKEGLKRADLEQHHLLKKVINKFTIGSIILSDPVVSVIRRELKRLSQDIKISEDDIRDTLTNDVIKREILEGNEAKLANKMVSRSEKKMLRKPRKPSDKNTLEESSELKAAS